MKNIRSIAAGICFGISAIVLATAPVQAVPISFEYNDTISFATSGLGLSVGQSAKITVTLDNGNATNISQTWSATDLVSVIFDFNNGGLLTTFNTPFDGGLTHTDGSFITDAAGFLTSVLFRWIDDDASLSITTDFSTNGTGTDFAWYLNGLNQVYFENQLDDEVELANVANMILPESWTQVISAPPTAVAEPGTLALFGFGLAGLGYMRRRRAA